MGICKIKYRKLNTSNNSKINMNETTKAKIIWFTILCIITNFIVCTLLSLFLSDYIDPYTNKAIIYYIFTAITGIYTFYLLIF